MKEPRLTKGTFGSKSFQLIPKILTTSGKARFCQFCALISRCRASI